MFVVAIGVAIVLIGLLVMTGALSWLGRLPGPMRSQRRGIGGAGGLPL